MSAPLAGKFQDHYKVLGVEPDASSEVIQRAYSFLAPKFHPDNGETADPQAFEAVNLAFEVLSDPVTKQIFDSVRAGSGKETGPRFYADAFFNMMATEMPRRHCILCVLYDRRRQQPLRPSLSLKQLEAMVHGNPEELHFSLWYLKQKGYAVSDDKSNLQISVLGMDYLDEVHPTPESIGPFLKVPPPAPVVESEPELPVEPPVAPPVEPVKSPITINIPRRTIIVPQSRVKPL